MEIPASLRRLLGAVPALNSAYLVGGCVRDALLGIPSKDFDLEVYGVEYEELADQLSRHGRVDVVGRSFGVIKFSGAGGVQWDFSLPRRDSKKSAGHCGFTVEFDRDLGPREAAARRDFTINALMFDPRTGEYLDFYGGRADLAARTLRHVGPAFTEDPLRVLRGMQFAARLDLTPAPETVELCRSIAHTYSELAIERVGTEWTKWATLSTRPSAGLRFLKDTGWLSHFPEILAIDGVPQDPEWHPEGDVFTHTCHACDALADLPEWRALDADSRQVIMFAVLGHDFAKATTTQTVEKGGRMRVVSPGHEDGSGPVADAFLARINASNDTRKRVVPLVMRHLAHLQSTTEKAVRRLATALQPSTIAELCLVIIADHSGRPPRPREVPAGVAELRALAESMRLADAAPKPLLLGRHLIARGHTPGKWMGPLLEGAFEAQLDGRFATLEGALEWLDSQTEFPIPKAE